MAESICSTNTLCNAMITFLYINKLEFRMQSVFAPGHVAIPRGYNLSYTTALSYAGQSRSLLLPISSIILLCFEQAMD